MSTHEKLAQRLTTESMRAMKTELFEKFGKIVTSDVFEEVVEAYDLMTTR